MMSPKRIGVVVAMDEEIASLLKSVGAQSDVSNRIHQTFRFQIEGREICVSVNPKTRVETRTHGPARIALIGTVPAALNTQALIQTFKPDLVINAGTCGGFASRGGRVGDVLMAERVYFHDRRVSLPGFKEFFDQPIACVGSQEIAEKLGLTLGVVSTGDSFDMSGDDLDRMNQQKAGAKEMEAAAVGYVCAQYQIPFIALKAVTDLVDEVHDQSAQEQFLDNLERASTNLCTALQKLLVSDLSAAVG